MAALVINQGPLTADALERMSNIASDQTHAGLPGEWAEHVERWAIHEGDLYLDASFDAATCPVLFVLGDLHVAGLFEDSDDPETLVCVTGNLHADNLITTGWLEVQGDLVVAGAILGDYNDCSAHVFGTMRARFFFPEEHYFEVGGLEVECALGSHYRLGLEGAPGYFMSGPYGVAPAARDAEIRAVVLGEYLLTEEDSVYVFEGEKDHRDMMRALRSGESVLVPAE